MPKAGRPLTTFRLRKHATKFVTSLLVITGLGGATVILSPPHRHAEVAAEDHRADHADTTSTATSATSAPEAPAAVEAPAPVPPAPLIVTKDSSPEDIVKAIVGQGQAAGLTEEQIKTVIATAKIESSFRPAVSGGVQAYGGRGTAAHEVIGLFQEKASFGTVAERQDPNSSIARFITRFVEAYRKHRISGDHVQAATLAQNPQLLRRNRGVGTHYYRTIQAAMGAASDMYHQAVAGSPRPIT